MSQRDENGNEEIPESPQALIGFMSNDEWDQLLDYVNAMISEMEKLIPLHYKLAGCPSRTKTGTRNFPSHRRP